MSELQKVPYSKEAERAILVSMVTDNNLIPLAIGELSSEDFYIKANGVLYKEIIKLWENHEEITPVLLYEKMKSYKNDEQLGNIYPSELFTEDFYTEWHKKHKDKIWKIFYKR